MGPSITVSATDVPQYRRLFVVFAWLNWCWTSLPLIDFLTHIYYLDIPIAVHSASAGSASATTTSGETFGYGYGKSILDLRWVYLA